MRPNSPHPTRSLRRSIIVLNVVLVLLATLSIGLVSLHLLNRQADSHALQVVELSGTQVRDAVARVPDELLATAIILRDRPTLARYVREGSWRQLAPFIEQFRSGGNLDFVGVVLDGNLVSEAGQRVDDMVLFQAGPDVRAHTVWALSNNGARDEFSAVAIAPLPEGLFAGTGYVVISRRITQSFLDSLSPRPGSVIVLLSRTRLGQALPDTPERQILLSEQPVIRALPESQRYAAALPLRDEQGRMIAGVMTYLPAAPFERNRNRLLTRWLLATVVLALLAALIGLAIGRRLGRPIRALTQAARRMAEQDFATPVPAARDIELDVLSSTMEDMRRRVLDLTATVRRREAQAQNLLENIVEGVFSVDEQRRILYMNPQAAKLLGVEGGHAIGRFCGDVLKPRGEGGRLPCHVNCPIIHARSGSGSRAHEVLCIGDEQRSVVIHSAPPSGNQQVQIIRDETQTEAGRRLRDAVIANVSHEFKTPLAAQTAAIELLQSGHGKLDEDQSGQLIEAMSRSTVRLNQLIDNLLESVRIDAREDRLDLHLLHIEDVIEQAVGVVEPLLLQRGQKLSTSLQPAIPEFLGDGQRLIQVLVNLLSNAIKYAPEETGIYLDVSTVGKSLRLVLEDEGPGLDEAESEAIFDRFYRAPGLSAGRAGMGLGLWIVKSIVQRHGGRIEFARTRAGGSSFRVFLPLKQEEA
ncbi:MAG: ATP-binding protein [Wenzhouxiangella sp.]